MGTGQSIQHFPVKQQDWFSHLLGYTEDVYKQHIGETLEQWSCDRFGHMILHSKTGENYSAGRYSVMSLKQLQKDFRYENSKSKVPITFFLRTDAESEHIVDVMSAITDIYWNDGVIQVASNMSGIEQTSEHVDLKESDFITNYIYDRTQGPRASIAAGPSAISRFFFGEMDDKKIKLFNRYKEEPMSNKNSMNTAIANMSQIFDQSNFLKNKSLVPYFPVKNGYVIYSENEHMPAFPTNLLEQELLSSNVCVGIHTDCQLTYMPSDGTEFTTCSHTKQKVTQVLCAAVNMRQGTSGQRNASYDDAEQKARFILKAMYEGVYLTAMNLKKKKVMLTLLGGGVFGNNLEWVYDAIAYVHAKWTSNAKSTIEHVYLLYYPMIKNDNWEDSSTVHACCEKYRIPYTTKVYQNNVLLEKKEYKF